MPWPSCGRSSRGRRRLLDRWRWRSVHEALPCPDALAPASGALRSFAGSPTKQSEPVALGTGLLLRPVAWQTPEPGTPCRLNKASLQAAEPLLEVGFEAARLRRPVGVGGH